MIKIENVEVFGWEAAIRGMRNPLNSWDKSDSIFEHEDTEYYIYNILDVVVGDNDLKLMQNLSKAGSDHSKYLRMINVTLDIVAPLYWWKEFDTYKVGTVTNSCSTMHTIHTKEFTLYDFSVEHLGYLSIPTFEQIIADLNAWRNAYNNYENMPETITKKYSKKECWYNMIQLLPSSYNQRRTVQLNYQVLKNMYHVRKAHKLDEWRVFCKWIESLPHSELITGAGE